MTQGKTGVWFVGACGAVATLTCVGARAVARGLKPPVGVLTETRLFDGLDLPALGDLVFGGHEIRDTDLHCAAREFAERAGILDVALLTVLQDDLAAIDANLRPGYVVNPTPAVEALADWEDYVGSAVPVDLALRAGQLFARCATPTHGLVVEERERHLFHRRAHP